MTSGWSGCVEEPATTSGWSTVCCSSCCEKHSGWPVVCWSYCSKEPAATSEWSMHTGLKYFYSEFDPSSCNEAPSWLVAAIIFLCLVTRVGASFLGSSGIFRIKRHTRIFRLQTRMHIQTTMTVNDMNLLLHCSTSLHHCSAFFVWNALGTSSSLQQNWS